jgi:hypothetical protein
MNPFLTREHCTAFARRVANILGEDVHILRTNHPECPRHVVSQRQLDAMQRFGGVALIEHSERAIELFGLEA